MSGQREWLKIWARTVGMPIGKTDEDKPRFMPIKQKLPQAPKTSRLQNRIGVHFAFEGR